MTSTSMGLSFRNWETLPNAGMLARLKMDRDAEPAVFLNGIRRPLPAPAGDCRGVVYIVSYLNNSNARIDHVEY